MFVKRLIFGGYRRLRKYTFIKINVFFSLIVFLLREFFLGFENANNYLRQVSQPCIIPILKLKGATVGKKCNIQSGITFHNCKNYKNFVVGENCHIGKNCFFDLRDEIIVSNNVVIAMNNTFITHLDMNNSNLREIYSATQDKIEVHDDVYIGTNCTILKGVIIQSQTIIGANSLVNKSTDSKHIYAGTPAVKVKKIDGV